MVDMDLLTYLETYLTDERKSRFAEVLENRTRFITLAVEDVFQMHNASAIVRSCDTFGIQDVHLIEGRYGDRLDKNIAMGAQKWVDSYSYTNTADCISALRDKKYKIVATTPMESSTALDDFKLETKIALFFGTEKEGLSQEVLKQADAAIRIPMYGFSESLNVSVSAAIILQKVMSELRKSDLLWALSEEEKFEKRLDWAKKTIKNVDQIIHRYESEHSGSQDLKHQ